MRICNNCPAEVNPRSKTGLCPKCWSKRWRDRKPKGECKCGAEVSWKSKSGRCFQCAIKERSFTIVCESCGSDYKTTQKHITLCRNCAEKRYVKVARLRHRSAKADTARKYRYGLSINDYEALLSRQEGVCKICKQPPKENKALAVDHDHGCCPGQKTCGRCIRGLICVRCNRGLGCFLDDSETVFRAARYLLEYESRPISD